MISMGTADSLPEIATRVAAIRRDVHAHPELAFAERRTAELVASQLERLGVETHRGIAGTGVVGRLRRGSSDRAIGLRADMDALPLDELNDFDHRSRHSGCMHACGHDGHVAMLLGAAEALTTTSRFDGSVYFIFQPAEEHEGGGRLMVEQGLFERFPMQAVFGLHNWPGLAAGQIAVMPGAVMAGADRFEIRLSGRGGHAAMPQQADDIVLAGSVLVQAVQTLVSRNTDPLEPAVLSVTRFHAGQADNILPERALLGGTLRSFSTSQQVLMEEGMGRICAGIAAAYGVAIDLSIERGYPPTINSPAETDLCRAVATEVFGAENLRADLRPSMGAEDFSYLLQARPGCYVWLGNGMGEGGCMLHSPRYDFNDAIIVHGMRYWLHLVERALPLTAL